MSINRSVGYWSFSECKYERKGMKKRICVCVCVSWGNLTRTLFRKLLNKSSIRRLNTNSCLCSRSVCADTHVLMCTRTCVNTLDPKHWCSYFCDSLLCCAQTRCFSLLFLLSNHSRLSQGHKGKRAFKLRSGKVAWGWIGTLQRGEKKPFGSSVWTGWECGLQPQLKHCCKWYYWIDHKQIVGTSLKYDDIGWRRFSAICCSVISKAPAAQNQAELS